MSCSSTSCVSAVGNGTSSVNETSLEIVICVLEAVVFYQEILSDVVSGENDGDLLLAVTTHDDDGLGCVGEEEG